MIEFRTQSHWEADRCREHEKRQRVLSVSFFGVDQHRPATHPSHKRGESSHRYEKHHLRKTPWLSRFWLTSAWAVMRGNESEWRITKVTSFSAESLSNHSPGCILIIPGLSSSHPGITEVPSGLSLWL